MYVSQNSMNETRVLMHNIHNNIIQQHQSKIEQSLEQIDTKTTIINDFFLCLTVTLRYILLKFVTMCLFVVFFFI